MQGIAISLRVYSCLAGQNIPHILNSAEFVIILPFHKITPVERVLNQFNPIQNVNSTLTLWPWKWTFK